MNWFRKNEEPLSVLYDAVFLEFSIWYKAELILDAEEDKANSLLLNLGMINVGSLASPKGRETFYDFFKARHNTATTTRLRDILAHLVAKFGIKQLDRVVTSTLQGLCLAHNVNMKILNQIQADIPTFWLIEMLLKCFNVANVS